MRAMLQQLDRDLVTVALPPVTRCGLCLDWPRDALTLAMMQADSVTDAELDALLQAVRAARGAAGDASHLPRPALSQS